MSFLPAGVQSGFHGYPTPWLDVNPDKLIALTQSLIDAGFHYSRDGEPGAKIKPIGLQATEVPQAERYVDCSGFTRWALFHASNRELVIPDGSVNQREWCQHVGFKRSTPDACAAEDGAVRIAFLTPDGAVRAGMSAEERHVMLVTGGLTMESHGGKGPDRRNIHLLRWFPFCEVFVLVPPKGMRPK